MGNTASSPQLKLKQAAEDIKDILRKYDIAAAVALHTPYHGEHFLFFNPSYSCAYQLEDDLVRFHAKLEDFASKKEHNYKLESTSNMLKVLMDVTAFNFQSLDYLSKRFDKAVGATHGKGKRS